MYAHIYKIDMKMLTKFKNEHHNIYIGVIAFLFAFFTLLSSACVTSFIYPHIPNTPYYNDGAMFYIMGSSMAKGYTPYLEVYDHKGLYIFYYTAIGGLLGRTGVFFFQVILLGVAFFFMYKTMELYTSRETIILMPLMFYAILYCFSGQSPNDSDMELPFNVLVIYFYLRAIKLENDKDFLFGNIFAGISTGIALNLRMLEAVLPFAFALFILVYCLMHKKYKMLFINAGIVVAGIVVMSIPPFLHAFAGHFLNEMVEAVFVSNFKYVGTSGARTDSMAFIAYIVVTCILIAFALLIYFKRKQWNKDFIIFVGVTAVVTSIIEVIIAYYPHYFIVLYPYYSLLLGILLLPYLEKEEGVTKAHAPTFITLVVFLIGAYAFNPVFYGLTQKEDEINITYINETIDAESKNGHTLVFGGTALYDACDIKIGYGDFTCQSNHVLVSERFSMDNLVAYLESADCVYVVSSDAQMPFVETVFAKLKTVSYTALARPADATITIFEKATL